MKPLAFGTEVLPTVSCLSNVKSPTRFELQGFRDDLMFDGFSSRMFRFAEYGATFGNVTKTRLNPQCMAYIHLHWVDFYGKCIGEYAILGGGFFLFYFHPYLGK